MKKNLQKALSGLCLLALLPSAFGAANAFSDADGHWANDALMRAADDGLLHGNQNSLLLPDQTLTAAEMAAILNRMLEAENTDRLYPGTAVGQWYTADAHKGASLGILPPSGALKLNKPITRAEAFSALSAAFGLDQAKPDMGILRGFPDAAVLTPAQQRAAAVLLHGGIIAGTAGGELGAAQSITRAEFVSLLYRIAHPDYLTFMRASDADENTQAPDGEDTPEDTTEENFSPRAVLYTAQPDEHSFSPGAAYDRVILRGNHISPDFLYAPVSIDRLTLATTGSDFVLTAPDTSRIGAIVIGGGTGTVTLADNLTRSVEITGSARTVDLRGLALDSLTISGADNTVLINAQTAIHTLDVLAGADGNRITADGSITEALLSGAHTTLSGAGKAEKVIITGKRCTVTLAAAVLDDRADNGLDGISISLTAPAVQPGGSITAKAVITGVEQARICAAQWLVDGVPDASFTNPALTLEEGRTSSYRRGLVFQKDMPLSHVLTFRLTYENRATGQTETRDEKITVNITNHPDSYYAPPMPSAAEVLAKVNPTYQKGNTDYSAQEKTMFVNAKGYNSPTKYMIWISRSAQMVNVFEGSKGNWELIHAFQCATGASRTPTPIGVTYVTYKQTRWTTAKYTCRPIVRFYPGTGYAFHSRLYYPGTDRLLDGSIGFPASAGCIRMMDEGIYWLYDHIPAKTTVVIY